MPSVTIIIAAYNASATIGRAVQSALAESEVAEVVVIDDASTDNTIAEAKVADDGSGRLKILVQSSNAGPSAARNRAIAESKSPWIGVLDADDYFLPGRITNLLKYLDNADFVADDMLQVVDSGNQEPKSLLGKKPATAQKINLTEFLLSNVTDPARNRGELGFLKPLMRRSFLNQHNIRYQENIRLGEDYELYARSLAHGARFYLAPVQGYVSVVRPNSLSGQHSENDLLRLRECDVALERDFNLSASERKALRQHYLSTDQRLQWRLLITAIKERDIISALACFGRPWPVPLYLFNQLMHECRVRFCKKLNG